MLHPELHRTMIAHRLDALRRAGRPGRVTAPRREDDSLIVLRLCRENDSRAVARLASLDGVSVPLGRLLLAEVDGRLVAALSLGSRALIADPFACTAHLRGLLKLRAAQLGA
jgi:hypothetical protein